MKPFRSTSIVPSILAIALSVTLAYRGRWQPRDVVWGMWVSSLIVGALWIVALFVISAVIGQREGRTDASWSGALVLMSVFLFLFLMIHAMQYGLLAEVLPFSEDQKLWPLGTTISAACKFWAIIVSALIAHIREFPRRALAAESEMIESGQRDPDFVARAFQPAVNLQVVLVGLLLIIFAHALIETFWRHSAAVDSIAVYASLIVAFLPVQLIRIRSAKE